MSVVTSCPKCGGKLVLPAFPGDGVYEAPHSCTLDDRVEWMRALRDEDFDEGDYELGQDGKSNRYRP
jgi:hypothetical protein